MVFGKSQIALLACLVACFGLAAELQSASSQIRNMEIGYQFGSGNASTRECVSAYVFYILTLRTLSSTSRMATLAWTQMSPTWLRVTTVDEAPDTAKLYSPDMS